MRTDVDFKTSDGTVLRGWHYVPEGAGDVPIVVMAHGISAVKEMWLDRYAERFAQAGLACLVFDHRNFGASDGAVRQEVDPWVQVRDFFDAITFAETLPRTDRDRIAVWGSSFSGGLGIIVAAQDARVKCLSVQVPVVSGSANLRTTVRTDHLVDLRKAFAEDRRARARGEAPGMIAVCSNDPNVPALLPTADAWTFFTGTAEQRAPSWRNEVTLRSAEMLSNYEPGHFIDKISPRPFQMIVDTADLLCPTDVAFEAYKRAGFPKQLKLLNKGHFTPYIEDFDESAGAAAAWFQQHLLDKV